MAEPARAMAASVGVTETRAGDVITQGDAPAVRTRHTDGPSVGAAPPAGGLGWGGAKDTYPSPGWKRSLCSTSTSETLKNKQHTVII